MNPEPTFAEQSDDRRLADLRAFNERERRYEQDAENARHLRRQEAYERTPEVTLLRAIERIEPKLDALLAALDVSARAAL